MLLGLVDAGTDSGAVGQQHVSGSKPPDDLLPIRPQHGKAGALAVNKGFESIVQTLIEA
jgi:hypothetical protein